MKWDGPSWPTTGIVRLLRTRVADAIRECRGFYTMCAEAETMCRVRKLPSGDIQAPFRAEIIPVLAQFQLSPSHFIPA